MKVDEFVTVYKLLSEQSFVTLPFTILAVYGLLELIFRFTTKKMNDRQNIVFGCCYAILTISSLCFIISKKNEDESMRMDALKLKQCIEKNAADYDMMELDNLLGNLHKINSEITEEKLEEIVEQFPNDFTIFSNIDYGDQDITKYITLNDTAIVNPHKRHIQNLTYIKIKGALEKGDSKSMNDFFAIDARLTYEVLERTCAAHFNEFVITPGGGSFRGNIKRIQ